MRWLFVLLVCLNVGYFLWVQLHSSAVQTAPVSASVSEPADGSSVKSLRLLGEAPELAKRSAFAGEESPSATLASADAAQLTGASCWFIGPMAERVTAKQVQLRFQEQGIVAVLLANPQRGALGYGLYLAPSSERAAADGQARILQLAGFAGARVVAREQGFDIEVGHYSSALEAEEASFLLKQQGYIGTVRKQHGEVSEPMLRIVLKRGQEVPGAVWRSLDYDFSELKKQKNWCGAIASVG